MSEQQNNLDPQVRDNLLGNLSMLSSVFYKTPEQFVKKIRDRINERLDLETQPEVDLVGGVAADYVDSTGVKRSEYLQQAEETTADYQAYVGGKQGNLLDLDEAPVVTTSLDDIFGTVLSSNTTSGAA